ncbi:MAG: Mth938-like domain-containing protein [Hyphomicrobiales bacterium]
MTAFFPGRAPIDAYGNGGFRFAGMSHRGSILVLPGGIHAWHHGDDLSPEDFALVFAEPAEIDVVLLGTGTAMRRPPQPVREAFAAHDLPLDCMSTGAAVRTYNILLAEDRLVAAALIAVADAE